MINSTLPSLIMVDLSRKSESKNIIVEKLLSDGLSGFVTHRVRLGVSCKMVDDH